MMKEAVSHGFRRLNRSFCPEGSNVLRLFIPHSHSTSSTFFSSAGYAAHRIAVSTVSAVQL